MATKTASRRWWLLLARGFFYMLIGVTMFVFSVSYSVQSATLIGVMAIMAGLSGLFFALSNLRSDHNNSWDILHGIADVIFGMAVFVYASGTLKGFVDVLGFWAMVSAFLQVVQAMYVSMAARQKANMSANYPFAFLYVGAVFVMGGLAFTALLRPQGFDNSLGMIGIFPLIFGVLVIALSLGVRAKA